MKIFREDAEAGVLLGADVATIWPKSTLHACFCHVASGPRSRKHSESKLNPRFLDRVT